MSRTVADYITPQNVDDADVPAFNPDGHSTTSYDLPLPPDASTESHRSILAFTLHATDPDDLHIVMHIGWGERQHSGNFKEHFTPIWNYTINSNVLHTVHQVVPTGALKAGVTNNLKIAVKDGGGSVKIENIVLWFKRLDEK